MKKIPANLLNHDFVFDGCLYKIEANPGSNYFPYRILKKESEGYVFFCLIDTVLLKAFTCSLSVLGVNVVIRVSFDSILKTQINKTQQHENTIPHTSSSNRL